MSDVNCYWKGGMKGVEGDFDEGLTSKVLVASAAVDNGDGTVRIESTTHTFIAGDYAVLDGTDNYDGNWLVENVSDADHIDIKTTFVAETFSTSDTLKGSNWQDKDGEPIAAPAVNDRIIFNNLAGLADDRSSKHREGRHWNLIGNIGQADTGELEIRGVLIDSDFTGKIGIDSENTISSFHLSIDDGYSIQYKGNYPVYIECSADDSATDINIPVLIHDSSSGYLKISSDMNSGAWTSLWDTIKCLNAGVLELDDDCAVQDIYMFQSTTKLIVGSGCVDVKDSNNPINLYLGPNDVFVSRVISNNLQTEAAINLGVTSFELTRQ